MSISGSKKIITAAFFLMLLIMSTSAHAGNLFSPGDRPFVAERQIGLFQQAIQWLGGTWNDLKAAFAEDGTSTPPACTNPKGCNLPNEDGGWTIDPDG